MVLSGQTALAEQLCGHSSSVGCSVASSSAAGRALASCTSGSMCLCNFALEGSDEGLSSQRPQLFSCSLVHVYC